MCESLRQAAGCLGLAGDVSVVHDFFGFLEGVPTNQVSLRAQLRALGGRHVHLDLIQVAAEDFNSTDRGAIDLAVQRARDTFAQVDLGVGRVAHFGISAEEADGLETIDSMNQAKKLTRRFRGPHDDAIDVFFVRTFSVLTWEGMCKIDLSCNKDKYNFSGAVIGIDEIFPNLLPHELGHGLGLKHVDTAGNLMTKSMHPTNPLAVVPSQGDEMRSHCFARPACCEE